MSKLADKQVTRNFKLLEMITHPTNSQEFMDIAWRNIKEFNSFNAERILQFLQMKRDHINHTFRDRNSSREIELRITSGFRPLEWEKKQKRSGLSRHTQTDAADIVPTNCSPELAVEIMQHLYNIDSDRIGGHQGGLAIKNPVIVNGIVKKTGFIHYDLRGVPARWVY